MEFARRCFQLPVPYDQKDKAKTIQGSKWLNKQKLWEFPIEAIQKVSWTFPDLMTDDLKKLLRAARAHQARVNYMLTADPTPTSKYAPEWLWAHQKVAFTWGIISKRFAFYMDMGTGKTAVIIALMQHFGCKTIIVGPLALLEGAWAADIQKFAPDLKFLIYQGSRRKKTWEKWKTGDYQVLITNYDTMRNDIAEISQEKFDCLVIDESSKMKAPTSKISKILIAYSELVDRVYLLSGTPAPNTPFEYFPQMRALSRWILGESFYTFRAKWGTPIGPKSGQWQKWIFLDSLKDNLVSRISRHTYVVKKDDCLDLPETIHTPLKVDWIAAQKKAYKQMRDEMVLELDGSDVLAQRAVTRILKLREITSGFVYDEDQEVKWLDTRKDQELMDLLERIGSEQVIIWFNFRPEAQKIKRLLKQAGISCCEAHGGIDQTVQKLNIDKFKSGDYRVLIGHPASIGHGLTLVNCRYAVYYSMSHSYELYAQSRDRIHRGGQTKKCQFFYLLVPGSIDITIYNAVIRKRNVADSLLEDMK